MKMGRGHPWTRPALSARLGPRLRPWTGQMLPDRRGWTPAPGRVPGRQAANHFRGRIVLRAGGLGVGSGDDGALFL